MPSSKTSHASLLTARLMTGAPLEVHREVATLLQRELTDETISHILTLLPTAHFTPTGENQVKMTSARSKAQTVAESLLRKSPELAWEVSQILGNGKTYLGPWYQSDTTRWCRSQVTNAGILAAIYQEQDGTWKGMSLFDEEKLGQNIGTKGEVTGVLDDVKAQMDWALRQRGVILLEDPSYLPAKYRPRQLGVWQHPTEKQWCRKDASTGDVKALVTQSNRRYSWKAWKADGSMQQGNFEAKRFDEHQKTLEAAMGACERVLAADGWAT